MGGITQTEFNRIVGSLGLTNARWNDVKAIGRIDQDEVTINGKPIKEKDFKNIQIIQNYIFYSQKIKPKYEIENPHMLGKE